METKFRDPGEDIKLFLFGQLKAITAQWLASCLHCTGDTYPAQLMYQELADMACNRIVNAITQSFIGEKPIKALLDPYNPTGSSIHVNFSTSKARRWQTDSRTCHINWVVLDSDWEAEFCRIAESNKRVIAYVKNQGLGLEIPYRYQSHTRKYYPDFIVLIDDGSGESDPLHLIVEIKGIHGEDARDKRATMENYWIPGVNRMGKYGRWAFLELRDPFQKRAEFEEWVEKTGK
jgi:type III restriction enzyme